MLEAIVNYYLFSGFALSTYTVYFSIKKVKQVSALLVLLTFVFGFIGFPLLVSLKIREKFLQGLEK